MTVETDRQDRTPDGQFPDQSEPSGGARTDRTSRHSSGKTVAALLTIVLLFAILLFPDHPESFTLQHFTRLPLEWPLIVLALLLTSGKALLALRCLLVATLGIAVLLRMADIGSRIAFDRRFSPLVEWHLLGDGWNLASQQVGLMEAGLALALALAVLTGLLLMLYGGLGAIGNLTGSGKKTISFVATTVLTVGVVVFWQQEADSKHPIVQAHFVPELIDRSQDMQRSIIDQQSFIAELNVDPISISAPPGFAALNDLDVAFIFIESYGQSFLVDEDLGLIANERLQVMEQQIKDAGLHVRSGWMTSPVRGGRSWLTHASLASGLEINNQARFDRLVASDRISLYSLFGQAGWHTVGLVPAIREAWPEGAWYGFDRIYDFHALDYQGLPFGWVSMPDQYTLSTFEQTIRQPSKQPIMAEIALISSHAPWTPLPVLLPWESIGDGSIFDGSHRFGEPMTWNNRVRVREMFAKSLDYSLATVGEYLSRHGKGALFMIHGDHQPASIIAGWGKTADVPVHIVSEDPTLLERLPTDVFTEGMMPDSASSSLPMWSIREMMSTVFESGEDRSTAAPPIQ
ncbi:MAG: hypothetical protein AB8B97_10475 [Granulosicoccus sp.]